jgi:hypothetical protein
MIHWTAVSAVSGCAWGLIAFVLLDSRTDLGVLGSVAAAPLIGVIMGRLSKGFRSRTPSRRAVVAVGSLYLAVVMFGLVGGVLDALCETPVTRVQTPGWIVSNAVESAFAMVLGLTAMGHVVALAPLAYANHLLVDAVGWD